MRVWNVLDKILNVSVVLFGFYCLIKGWLSDPRHWDQMTFGMLVLYIVNQTKRG